MQQFSYKLEWENAYHESSTLTPSHVANVIFDMATEEEEYDAVFHFLRSGEYPAGFSKNEKRALRRKAKDNYKVEKDALFYRPRGGSSWKKVPRFWKERERIIDVCHVLPEGIQL